MAAQYAKAPPHSTSVAQMTAVAGPGLPFGWLRILYILCDTANCKDEERGEGVITLSFSFVLFTC